MERAAAPQWVFAPAKVNLWLHVLGRRADGFHELESLVAFARAGDRVGLAANTALSVSITGPEAGALAAESDNLVLRAARALADRVPGLRTGEFKLEKNLPVASGLGGGSSDAAAALRALCALNELAIDDARVRNAAEATGSDVPVCLVPRARPMSGRGEQVGDAIAFSSMPVVLANPRVAVSTAAVFAELGLKPGQPFSGPAPASGEWLERLANARNDLQAPAMKLAPAIGETLDRLAAEPGARLVRMSGSGATCFALFDDSASARRAAARLRRSRPNWWVRATQLA